MWATYYNFVRIRKTLKMSPAMTAGVTDMLWKMSDIVAVVNAAERAPASADRTRNVGNDGGERFSRAHTKGRGTTGIYN